MRLHSALAFFFAILFLLVLAPGAIASGSEHLNPVKAKPLQPAKAYHGRTPIDISNGLLFNNGTYGAPNPAYEKFAQGQKTLFPGINDSPYPYALRESFVSGLMEAAQFVDDAIFNWRMVSPITKPEAKEYGERAAATMEPVLSQFREIIAQAKVSSQTDWDKVQADARNSLGRVRAAYSELHKNVK